MVEFRQAVAETGPFGRRCMSILPCSSFPLPRSSNRRCGFPASGFPIRFQCDPFGRIFESHPDGVGWVFSSNRGLGSIG
jgi:hypothetical protein